MSATAVSVSALTGLALYVGHHVGDYWVQTDEQAAHKGDYGMRGVSACSKHVLTYTLTQALMLMLTTLITGMDTNPFAVSAGLLVSALTHYAADRREHGLMFKLARLIPGIGAFA